MLACARWRRRRQTRSASFVGRSFVITTAALRGKGSVERAVNNRRLACSRSKGGRLGGVRRPALAQRFCGAFMRDHENRRRAG